jgi:hypothetical protein
MIQAMFTHGLCFVIGAIFGIVGLALFVAGDDREQPRPEGWPEG